MTKFTETTTTTYVVACPECDSQRVHKAGTQKGEQRYRCNGCGKKFRAGGKAKPYKQTEPNKAWYERTGRFG